VWQKNNRDRITLYIIVCIEKNEDNIVHEFTNNMVTAYLFIVKRIIDQCTQPTLLLKLDEILKTLTKFAKQIDTIPLADIKRREDMVQKCIVHRLMGSIGDYLVDDFYTYGSYLLLPLPPPPPLLLLLLLCAMPCSQETPLPALA
jgi:hypothetical protein